MTIWHFFTFNTFFWEVSGLGCIRCWPLLWPFLVWLQIDFVLFWRKFLRFHNEYVVILSFDLFGLFSGDQQSSWSIYSWWKFLRGCLYPQFVGIRLNLSGFSMQGMIKKVRLIFYSYSFVHQNLLGYPISFQMN